jgi:hypothetical protein
MTLDWPLAFLIVTLVFFALVSFSTPSRKRHEVQMAEIKAKSGEQYKALSDKYETLAQRTSEVQAAMQTELARVAAGVESIEAMMREVG